MDWKLQKIMENDKTMTYYNIYYDLFKIDLKTSQLVGSAAPVQFGLWARQGRAT
jgi:hypothetical protein